MEQEIGTIRNCKNKKRSIFLVTGEPPYKYVTVEVRGGKEPETLTFPIEKPNGNYVISSHVRMKIKRKFTKHENKIVKGVEKALNSPSG